MGRSTTVRTPTDQDPRIIAIGALYHLGKSEDEICVVLGMAKAQIRSLEMQAAKHASVADGGAALGRAVLLPAGILPQLDRYASPRGIAPNTLARKIIEFALRDNLVDAIIDDGIEAVPCPA